MVKDVMLEPLETSGNIFVDQGQLTLKILLKKKLSEPLLVKDVVGLEKAGGFAGFPWLVANITRFKAYSMIYTMNHPRSNPSEKDEKVKMDTFHALLVALVKGIEREFDPARAKQSTCDVCGHAHDFVFDEVFRSILEQLQKKPSLKFPCREFFPLAGTMGGEAQTFSNMSKGPNICPRCLLMVYYLPFSSQVIEGNLAIFQLSDPRLQYLLVSRVVQKCVERINIAKPDDKIETDGKDKKHKNELVFEQLLDLFKSVLPASPTPADVKASFPGRNVDCWLWKYTNAGQGAYLSYEHIPNALVYFVYTCYCFDLHESLISMLKQELKDIKYTPKQFFNCIRGKMLYDFDKLDGRKYALDSRIVFLYYYYILGYNKPMLNAIMQIAMQVKAHLSDAGKDLKNRARVQAIIMSQARKLMQDGKISPATYHSVFGFNMQARKAKIAFDLVNQVLKLDLAAKNLDEYDTQVRQYLEGENLDLYDAAPELHVQQDEIWACHVSRMLVSYFKAKKMRGKDIIEKIVEQRMKNAPLKWFSTLLSSACLASSMAVEPVDYFYMLHIAGGWYGLRPVLQAIMTAILQYDGKDTRSIMDAIPAPVPAEFRSKNRNPSIERILTSYLDFRVKVQGKGLGYMLRNFGIPFIKSRITTTMLARFLQDHARDNGDVDEKQRIDYDLTDVEEMLINPVTGIQDPAYFTQYAKVFIASYFIAAARQPVALAKEKSDATRMEEELKVTISEVLDVEGNDDEEIVEESAGEEEVVDSEPAETEESGEIEETNGNEE